MRHACTMGRAGRQADRQTGLLTAPAPSFHASPSKVEVGGQGPGHPTFLLPPPPQKLSALFGEKTFTTTYIIIISLIYMGTRQNRNIYHIYSQNISHHHTPALPHTTPPSPSGFDRGLCAGSRQASMHLKTAGAPHLTWAGLSAWRGMASLINSPLWLIPTPFNTILYYLSPLLLFCAFCLLPACHIFFYFTVFCFMTLHTFHPFMFSSPAHLYAFPVCAGMPCWKILYSSSFPYLSLHTYHFTTPFCPHTHPTPAPLPLW